jgi:WD40 repeat protein
MPPGDWAILSSGMSDVPEPPPTPAGPPSTTSRAPAPAPAPAAAAPAPAPAAAPAAPASAPAPTSATALLPNASPGAVLATTLSPPAPPGAPLATTLSPDPVAIAPLSPASPAPAGQGFSVGGRVKHYELLRELGQGGMGAVYLARDTKLGRLVALKRLLRPSVQGSHHVLVEARATARCKHENIVVVHEVDEHEGTPYLVLEYVEGSTLRAWMAQRAAVPATPAPPGAIAGASGAAAPASATAAPERVSASLAVELMVPVVRALVCAHEQGVVHRDLKPENILLADAGPIKVVDFGIAKQLSQAAPPAGGGAAPVGQSGPKGTLLYMAPEQWRGDESDPRVDLWAVGVMLYELCAGAHPLAPGSLAELAQVMNPLVPMPSLLAVCPEAGALAAVVDRCLCKRREERFDSARDLLAALEALRAGQHSTADGAGPFPGLSAFQEADAGRFFGRDAEVAGAARMLRSQPLLAVVGASGAGKSSFVRAGLIPALRRSGERWEAFVLRPGRKPLRALAELLARASEAASTGGGARGPGSDDVTEFVTRLQQEPGALGVELRARCRQGGRVLLFVDQFEELYTLGAGAEERAVFLACLEGVADDASSPLRVVLALRADFLERLIDERTFLAEVARGLVPLAPPGREGLREALVRPAEAAGHRFESEGLLEQILAGLEGARSPLPLLQFLAAELWEARDRARRRLTEASYEQLGGVAGALAAHADAVLARLPAPEQRLVREIFLRLVTPERTRAVVSLDELHGLGDEAGRRGGAVERVVQRLVEARLLAVETGREHDGTTVELVHESLIERWPQLGRWLDESAQDVRFLARLRAAAQQWRAGGEAEGLLWRGGPALEARTWLERRAERGARGAGLGEQEERYLRATVALADRKRRGRWLAVAGVIASLGAFALAVSSFAFRANREAALARNATRLAAARELLPSDPTGALALVREIEPPEVPRGWDDVARTALQSGVSRLVLPHHYRVLRAAFSPDGRRLVTASADKMVRVWNVDSTGEPLVLRGHDEEVLSAAFSPDGRRLVTTSVDRTARVWNADGTGEPLLLRGHGAQVSSAAFSPDGRQIVTASADKTVRVWAADGAGEPLVLRGHEDEVYAASFSPDGRQIVTASGDGTTRVWNADGAGEPLVLRDHGAQVFSATFSPDGRQIATASEDKTARVWNADGTGEPLVLRGHEGRIFMAAFSPDGRQIVTASGDGTARVWDAGGKGELQALHGHSAQVFSAAFSPDGRQIVTASEDKTVRTWSSDGLRSPRVLRGHEASVGSAAFSPDGRRIVTASEDRTARVWATDGTGEPVVLRGHDGVCTFAAFSPDGRRVVTASEDKAARVWNADGTGGPLVLRGHEGRIFMVTFSPDGRHIVTASEDKTARVWNADDARERLVLRGHESGIYSSAFSPDGRHIVTASVDRTARVWPADGAGEPLVLRGHKDRVITAAFSPDGRQIVTASVDGTARVWSAAGRGEPLVLGDHGATVTSAAFSPDGRQIVTASGDGAVRIWSADGTGGPLILRGHEGVVEWAAFSPNGRQIVTASADKTVRIWADLEPLPSPESPALWQATAYCLPVDRRVALLNVTEAQARADDRTCRRRVENMLAAAPLPR